MTDPPPRTGNRVVAALGAALLVAVGVVVFLATRGEPAPPPKPRVVEKPRVEERHAPPPRAPRAKVEAVAPVEPQTPAPQVEPPPAAADDGEKAKLDVEVLGSDGADAPGATVIVLDPFAQHVVPRRPIEIAHGTTDATGHASFDIAARAIRVYARRLNEAGVSDKAIVKEAVHREVVRLSPAVAGRGRVADAGGAPVADADVRFVMAKWLDDPFGIALETKSAADGSFELPPIPVAAFDVPKNGAAVEARAKGWPTARVEASADSLQSGDLVVVMERGGMVRGRFVSATGQAVSGEEARVADGRSATTSGADGRFELPLPKDGGVVIARPSPSSPSASSVPNEGFGAPKLLGRFRGDAGDVDLGDVTLAAGQPVKGAVVDLNEEPMKASDVVLYLAGVQVAATQTDDAGKFEFLDAVGDDAHVVVATEAPTGNAWSGRRHASVDSVRGGASDLRIEITGALSVLVKFVAMADNSPVVVPEVRVRVDAVGSTPRQYGWTWAGARINSVRFEVENAGQYTATFDLPGYVVTTSPAFDVSADRGMEITVLFAKKP